MTRIALNTLTVLAVIGSGLDPVLCCAHALDAQLDCKSNAHAFIAPLVSAQSIDPNPMRVEANSVNAFRPAQGSNLTAFGFRVCAVLGYERDDAIFKEGSGEPITESAYPAGHPPPSHGHFLRWALTQRTCGDAQSCMKNLWQSSVK